MMRFGVCHNLDEIEAKLRAAQDMDIDTLQRYAYSVSFTANCQFNDMMERFRAPYPSLIEMRASLLMNKEKLERELSVVSKPATQPTVGNELNDMADEEEGSGGEMDEETASIITQSLLQVRNVRPQKKVNWDSSSDDESDSE
ncbi:hypothetical protein AV274_4503 [Blastocystis sp. ATCC 50177/Nand II]|uniref:Uncharacterized protein n=1 Tax=Blastocystis sp. subtype 1 (strain ATCC 50177 / NandII) TaxID=478820 RepID=A0A196S9X7_BLAHN|nr:hypothetical protein AV274_4503 [Blastocystis sp. ATCC 50177/Nand II]